MTGETEFPDVPIEIIEQNTTSVTIKIVNPFNTSVNSIFTQYHESPTGATECQEERNVPPESDPTAEDNVIIYTAYCLHTQPITIVDIWFSDCKLEGGATVPECCHASDEDECPKVNFSFKIMCETLCIDDDVPPARKLEDKQRNEETKEAKNAASPHHCSNQDYPCGENDENVSVCHYSARDGYQSFCVPESDSDVVAYYPKDYCGRCVGGYEMAKGVLSQNS
jgi:hypothetical protein